MTELAAQARRNEESSPGRRAVEHQDLDDHDHHRAAGGDPPSHRCGQLISPTRSCCWCWRERRLAQPAPQPLQLLDVPFISQTEALCGGAAAAMVLRYWGERGWTPRRSPISWTAVPPATARLVGDYSGAAGRPKASLPATLLTQELTAGRPVIALIEDRPGTFHYVVIVAAAGARSCSASARAPCHVASAADFGRQRLAAGRWMAVITPRVADARSRRASADPTPAASTTPCDQRVADGVRAAQTGDLDAAERSLTAAIACRGPAALRELAGLRVLQRRWQEADRLASAAVAVAPHDRYAWRVLATSRFLQDDAGGALEAWNQVGEPRVDLLRVNGLTHTRQRVVERLISVTPGAVLERSALAQATRRLSELPSAVNTRRIRAGQRRPGGASCHRVRTPGGAVVASRLPGPRRRGGVAARDRVADRVDERWREQIVARWRFWPGRPLYAGGRRHSGALGGVWRCRGLVPGAAVRRRDPHGVEPPPPCR